MAILASAIIASVRRILLDPVPGVTWVDAALLAMMNEGERAFVNVKREIFPLRTAVALVAGTKQTLPAGGVALIECYDNVVSGRRCTLVHRELMDSAARFFPIATPEIDAQHYLKDDRDPTRFDVVPPNIGTGSLNILYGAVPSPIAAVTNNINLSDIYEGALIAFVLAKAYAENTTRTDLAKSGAHTQEWKGLLGMGTQSQVAVSPKVGAQGGSA